MRKLASPRKVKVNPYLTVTRIYADVTCVDCGFKGAPHVRNFATTGAPGGPNGHGGGKKKNGTKPVCQKCMVIRRAERYAEEDLRAKVYFEERRRRKKMKSKQDWRKNTTASKRWRAKRRIMRSLERGG